MRDLWAGIGALLVLAVAYSVAQVLVIPRGRVGLLRFVDRVVDNVYGTIGRRLSSYDRRDSWRSSQPAILLGLLLAIWLGGLLVGFALLLSPFEPSLAAAFRESGSSLFTLGFALRRGGGPTALDVLAGAAGLLVIALQISYLPTIYSAYARRETEVALLGVRAGEPPWGPELLARTRFGGRRENLGGMYATWERWAADVAESHASYPALMRFRSQRAADSWLVGLLAVMDSAAMYLAVAPDAAPIEARLLLRMGIRCLNDLAATVGIATDLDPRPDAPIRLTLEEFSGGYERLVGAEFPVEVPVADAWPQFRGWRVNYERAAYTLAWGIDAVPALWSGPRAGSDEVLAPGRPPNRTPESPEGAPPTVR